MTTARLSVRDHKKVPSGSTVTVLAAGVAVRPPIDSQRVTRAPARPVEVPLTRMRLRSSPDPREPVMASDFVTGAVGVTDALGDEAADQPAPVSAFTDTV